MKIAVILPSRNRPEQCLESIDKLILCCSRPENLFFYVIVDHDDPQKHIYEKLLYQKINLLCHISYSNKLLNIVNDMAEQAYQDNCEIFMFHGDDAMFNPSTCQDWDIILQEKIEQFEDKVCLCYFDDSVQGDRLATHPIITRQWYEILGYFVPEIFHLSYMDNWLYEIAKSINRAIYIPQISFNHQHFSIEKAKQDNTYRRNMRYATIDGFHYKFYTPLRDKHTKTLIKHIYPKKIANRMLRKIKIKRFFEKFF